MSTEKQIGNYLRDWFNGAKLASTPPIGESFQAWKLICLTLTQSVLAYVVHVLAQFMQFPCKEHWTLPSMLLLSQRVVLANVFSSF